MSIIYLVHKDDADAWDYQTTQLKSFDDVRQQLMFLCGEGTIDQDTYNKYLGYMKEMEADFTKGINFKPIRTISGLSLYAGTIVDVDDYFAYSRDGRIPDHEKSAQLDIDKAGIDNLVELLKK